MSELSEYILKSRYLQEGETPDDLWRRVAHAVASVEEDPEKYEEVFYNMMKCKDFLPNSPTLFNAGLDNNHTLSACFVLPVHDSMDSIMETATDMAMIFKMGGGVGFDFSELRPKGALISTTGGESSGPVSFMKMYDGISDAVRQGGFRRGAAIGILRIDHPDIHEFIHAKDEGGIENFNISVSITDEFMTRVLNGDDEASDLFDEIVESAWKTGDPGVIFIDEINNKSPHPEIMTACNPCSELSLLPFESCNLGSINLSKMISYDENRCPYLDEIRLERTVRAAVHFLDDIIEINPLPDKIKEQTEKYRKIGLGIMGWHDFLITMGIQYDSEKALGMAERIFSLIVRIAHDESYELSKNRGTYAGYKEGLPKRRNITTTTIAPTGTISLIAGCSSGIEPHFELEYTRRIRDNDGWKEVEIDVLGNFDCKPDKRVKTSHEIAPLDHLKMQAAFQKYVESSISKTINLPEEATETDIHDIYIAAYEMGLKGVTVFRDNCRAEQVLSKKKEEKPKPASNKPRSKEYPHTGTTYQETTGCGHIYITVNSDATGKPIETFVTIGKAGGCALAQNEAISRIVSLCLQHNVPIGKIITQLQGIRCPMVPFGKDQNLSCPDAIATALSEYIGTHNGHETKRPPHPCPECGAATVHKEGCISCTKCTYSRCG